jgi:hypothetical protein
LYRYLLHKNSKPLVCSNEWSIKMTLFGFYIFIDYVKAPFLYDYFSVSVTNESYETLVYSLDDQCRDETLALTEKRNFTDVMQDSYFCTVDFALPNKTCVLDLTNSSMYMSNSTLEEVCVSAGGQYYEQDSLWDCTVTTTSLFNRRRQHRGKSYINLPGCFGVSCNANDIQNGFDTYFFPEIEVGTPFQCNISSNLTSSSSSDFNEINQQHDILVGVISFAAVITTMGLIKRIVEIFSKKIGMKLSTEESKNMLSSTLTQNAIVA